MKVSAAGAPAGGCDARVSKLQLWQTWHNFALDVTENRFCGFWSIRSFCREHGRQISRLDLRTYREALHTGIVIANPVDQFLCSLSILQET